MIGVKNRYFDFEDYDTPVKTYTEGSQYYRTLKSFHKQIFLYLRKNEYVLNDDLIQYRDQQKGSYYSVGREKIDLQEIHNDTVISIHFMQDGIVDQYERTIFTILEMTGQLGGLYEILTLLASFLISSIVQKFFTMSILKNLYVVE